MNILTKICVVVLALASIFASVVFAHQALDPANYRHAYEQEVQGKQLAQMDARNSALALRNAQVRIAELESTHDTEVRDLRDRYEALQAEKVQLEKTKNDLVQTNTRFSDKLQELEESLKVIDQRRQQLSEDLTAANDRVDTLQAQLNGTENELAELQQLNDRKAGEIRVLHEQLTQREEEVKALEENLRSGGGVVADAAEDAAETYVPPVTLHGTITAVQADPGLASINIGRVKGVRRGMSMYIYRGSDFVGHLQIEEVDDSESAGVVVGLRPGMTVQQGDKVTTSLE